MLHLRNIGIAGEPGELHGGLLAQGFELVLVGSERKPRLIVVGLGNDVAPHERCKAVVVCLIQFDLRLLGCDVAQHALVVLLHRFDGQCRLRKIGLRIVERDLELPGIDPEQNIDRLDELVFMDVDRTHHP